MTITIIGAEWNYVGILENRNHWLMFLEGDSEPFDEYFTCDLFDLLRECLAPIC